jgi:hypothetical protein
LLTEQTNALIDGGGVLSKGCPGLSVFYDFDGDTHPQKQDAAKLLIETYTDPSMCDPGYLLTNTIDADDITLFTSPVNSGTFGPPGQRSIRIDNEAMMIRSCTAAEGGTAQGHGFIAATGMVCVTRGAYGTTPAAHTAGAQIKKSNNAMNPYLHISLGKVVGASCVTCPTDGHTYLISWDEFYTDSYLIVKTYNAASKTYQLQNGGGTSNGKLWETRLRFDGAQSNASLPAVGWNPATDVAAIDVRPYNSTYGGIDTWSLTNGNTMGNNGIIGCGGSCLNNQVGQFIVKPNTWVRFWIKIVQQANDFDLISLYVADENNDAVTIFSNIKMSVSASLQSAHQTMRYFDFEKQDSLEANGRGQLDYDLVSYARNWFMLEWTHAAAPDLAAAGLLARPVR